MSFCQRIRIALFSAFLCAVPSLACAATGDPIGSPIQVATVGDRSVFLSSHDVAIDGAGNFVAIWIETDYSAANSVRIIGQRYHSDGSSAGRPFVVNSTPLVPRRGARPTAARIAMADDGRFVVAWASEAGPAFIHVRTFDANASPTSPDISLALSVGEAAGALPSVAIGRDGAFALAWAEKIPVGPSLYPVISPLAELSRIRVQRFDAQGNRRGLPIEAGTAVTQNFTNRYTDLNERVDATGIAIDDDGLLSVAWERYALGYGPRTVQLVCYDLNGRRVGPEVSISDATTPSLSVDRYGRRLVSFISVDLTSSPSTPSYTPAIQRFYPSGVSDSPRIEGIGTSQGFVRLAVRPEGDAVLVARPYSLSYPYPPDLVQFIDVDLNPITLAKPILGTDGSENGDCTAAASRAEIAVVICGYRPYDSSIYVQRFATE